MARESEFIKICNNFQVYLVIGSENEAEQLKGLMKDKLTLIEQLRTLIDFSEYSVKSESKLEIFVNLLEFCIKNNFSNLEICAIFSIYHRTLNKSFLTHSKMDIFNHFKNLLIKHSMDRPPYQIGIFKKINMEHIVDYFIDNVYKKFELLKFLLTNKQNIEIINTEIMHISFPHVLGLEFGQEILPRQLKILKPYYENKRPKSEFEQKVEVIMEFERDVLDKDLEKAFKKQDEEFQKKLDELAKKKK